MSTLVKWLKENVSRELRKKSAEERIYTHPNDFFQDPVERIKEEL